MTTLQHILYKVPIRSVSGSTDIVVNSIEIDSRKISAGACFVAIKGVGTDGHQFIDSALKNGAIAIVCEMLPSILHTNITYVQVADTTLAAGIIAANFYNHPSEKIKLVGVTGTNGKTTIATLLYKLFTLEGFNCGLISTVQIHIGNTIVPSTHTTPDVITINKLLAQMIEAGCTHAFMEVSSHAIHQQRIAGLLFTGGIFSNITHDHLDYHKTFDAYIKAKKMFFDNLSSSAFAITNVDDKRGMVMLQNTAAKKITYSLKSSANYKAKIIENSLSGLILNIQEQEVHFRLIGEFNAYNLLAVYAAACELGMNKIQALQGLSNITGAEGRFDYRISPKDKIIGIIDYAHTPDALLNVLTTIKKLRKGYEQVITVVGCGGDRDRTKRPLMAQVACDYSDKSVFTSDNPRTENPQQIFDDMQQGLNSAARRKSFFVEDRREAIKLGVSFCNKEDIVLIAGKGHEKYQVIQGVQHPFDDMQVMLEMFELLDK